ncbi:OmpA family protein [Nocardiopsis algeriensis]|uniref:OmpA family protein n=1 Tax=Nocardiopsis algeriensis TaxID=1478215 RepID=UPI003B439AFE
MTERPKTSRKEKRIFASLVPTSALALFLAGCVVSSDDPQQGEGPLAPPGSENSTSPSPKENEPGQAIASSITSATEIGEDFVVEVYALEDVGNGLLRLHFGVTNNSSESYNLYDGLATAQDKRTGAGITLLDPKARNRHLSFRQSDGSCFCSTLEGPVPAGETEEMWVIFPAPEDKVETMTVTTPITPPIMDVPVTTSTEKIENTGLASPQVLPLTMISEDPEDNTGRTEVGEEVSILLSSDVLFETNSSTLSEEAQDILEQVATEIDDASSETVEIDGHADNTGSDSINLPLSQDRAEAVENKLEELITRPGVEFNVTGHGSSNPIATNDTEEGRERNRRVSVTFEK